MKEPCLQRGYRSMQAKAPEFSTAASLEGVVITSDESANAVVVRAPSEAMPLIAELVRQLDTSPGVESFVKVFTIENGDRDSVDDGTAGFVWR